MIGMKHLTLVFTLLFLTLGFGQTDKVQGTLSSVDTADLSILNIFPESFPKVSVVFKAQTRKGEPVWDLTKEKMKVKENSQDCEVILLEKVSKNNPINLGIVIDHSGSMIGELFDEVGDPLFPFDDYFFPIFPEGYKTPLDNAKLAVKKFVTTFNVKKDFISILGFADVVDIKIPLTQDREKINAALDSMQADFSTALYDAMITGIEEIKKADGIKVLIVLTDGHDNNSRSSINDIIKKAKQEDIPIYIIGLGDVNKELLQQIATATKGQFYFTESASSLDEIYATISKQIQAFYNLVYISPNLSSIDATREVELSFDIDGVFLVTDASSLDLPKEVVVHLAKKEKEREYLIYGGSTVIVILLSSGLLLFYSRRKKKNKPIINKLFPNPSSGTIHLDYQSNQGQLIITSLTGNVVKNIEINGSETQFELSDLQDGNYVATLHSEGQQSNAMKFIIKR